ncbi:MAG: hypothetical protein ABH919_03930 [bacterium]
MKKLFSTIALSLLALLTVFSFAPKSVLADGMMIKPNPYLDSWNYSGETNQQAFINHNNGLQRMIIGVGFEEENSDGVVWLFPVPADPNKVTIDVVKNLPQLRGEEISKKAKSNLNEVKEFLRMTQFYTILFVSPNLQTMGRGDYSNDGLIPLGIGKNSEIDVMVYEHLDKEGISSEIITAKTANGLYDYLKNKGLKIEIGSIPILDNYIGKDFTFVVSWINSSEKIIFAQEIENNLDAYFSCKPCYQEFFKLITDLKRKYPEILIQNYSEIDYLKSQQGEAALQELTQAIQNDPSIITDHRRDQRGIFVTFPTENIYFPMLPTSVYGSEIVPATIRVLGHVTPKVFQDIKSYTKVEYYINGHSDIADDDLEDFYNGQNQNIKYTKIEINAPSKFFTNDLWISNEVPAKTYYSTFMAQQSVIILILLLIVSSSIAGILAGWISFKKLRKKTLKLGLIGLSNCFSLFGLLITTVFISTKEKDESLKPVLIEIKRKGYFWKRKLTAILLLLDLPFLILFLFFIPSFLIEESEHLFEEGFFYGTGQLVVLLFSIAVAVLVFSLIIKKIKHGDENLFEQLRLNNYSSWSFQPKDKAKIVFIPLFSVLFLIVSWLLVELIKFTV